MYVDYKYTKHEIIIIVFKSQKYYNIPIKASTYPIYILYTIKIK